MRSVILLLLILIAIPSFAGDVGDYMKRGHRSPEWTPLVKEGLEAFGGGDQEMGASFLKRAMEKGCKDGLVYFKLGLYYEQKGDLANARQYLELAEKALPGKYASTDPAKTIHEHLGRVMFMQGDNAAAKAELMKAMQSQGPGFTPVFLLGSIARNENDLPNVIQYYRQALTMTPPEGTNTQEVLFTMLVEIGKAHFELGQYDESLAIWNQVLQMMPDHPVARQYKTKLEGKKSKDAVKTEEQRIMEQIVK